MDVERERRDKEEHIFVKKESEWERIEWVKWNGASTLNTHMEHNPTSDGWCWWSEWSSHVACIGEDKQRELDRKRDASNKRNGPQLMKLKPAQFLLIVSPNQFYPPNSTCPIKIWAYDITRELRENW